MQGVSPVIMFQFGSLYLTVLIIIAWESNPPPTNYTHMRLYPGLAIVTHAQYSELN